MKPKIHLVILITAILATAVLFWYDYTHDVPHNPDSLATILIVGTIYTGLIYAALTGVYFSGKILWWLVRRIVR